MTHEDSTNYCEECGAQLTRAPGACPKCGSTRRSLIVRPRGVRVVMKIGNIGTVADGTDADGMGRRIAVTSPVGSRSEAVSRDGDVLLEVSARGDVGRTGEPRVRDILLEALRSSGCSVNAGPGDDARGEDGLLRIDGRTLAIQAVTVPLAREFWREAAIGSATTRVTKETAAQWIHQALEKKASALAPNTRKQVLLAMDAKYAGVLPTSDIVQLYHSLHPPACKEFGFAAVWIVGPSASLTTCLDTIARSD